MTFAEEDFLWVTIVDSADNGYINGVRYGWRSDTLVPDIHQNGLTLQAEM